LELEKERDWFRDGSESHEPLWLPTAILFTSTKKNGHSQKPAVD
jgi:hypothetical protein